MKPFASGFLGGAVAVVCLAVAVGVYTRFRAPSLSPEDRARWATYTLRDLALEIETYRLVFGRYPESLKEARGGSGGYDEGAAGCECPGDFYYRLLEDGESYYLLSKGADCAPLSPDDIFPNLSEREKSGIGFRAPRESAKEIAEMPCSDPQPNNTIEADT